MFTKSFSLCTLNRLQRIARCVIGETGRGRNSSVHRWQPDPGKPKKISRGHFWILRFPGVRLLSIYTRIPTHDPVFPDEATIERMPKSVRCTR